MAMETSSIGRLDAPFVFGMEVKPMPTGASGLTPTWLLDGLV